MVESQERRKRFRFQKDGLFNIYKARRSAVQEAVYDLKNNTEMCVIGATLCGSLSKGTSHYMSDVDVFLFYDTNRAARRLNVSEKELFESSTLKILKDFKVAKAQGKNFFELPLATQVALAYLKVGEESIRQRISRLQMPTKPQVIPVGISEHVVQDALTVLTGGKGIQDPIAAASRLKALFHLAVTQGVFPYRKQVLSQLLRAGPRGQKVWKALIQEVIEFENFDKKKKFQSEQTAIPRDTRYPQTLSAAVRLYAR